MNAAAIPADPHSEFDINDIRPNQVRVARTKADKIKVI